MKAPHLSVLALAAMTALCALPSWAAPVLSALTSAEAPLGTPGSTSSYSTPPTYAGSQSFAFDLSGNADGYAFSSQHGSYAVSSDATGRSLADADASFLYTLQNTSNVALAYSMSFYIYSGYISALVDSGTSLDAGESLVAAYSARISVDGLTRFSSAVTVANSDTGITVTKSGTQFDEYSDGTSGYYAWGGNTYTIDLGVLAAGESIDILAEVGTDVFANVGTYDFSGGGGYGGYGGYGGECYNNQPSAASTLGAASMGTTACFKGRSEAFYGDPIDFSSSGPDTGQGENLVAFASRPANDVPEPGSLALAGLALAAAAGAARRRRS